MRPKLNERKKIIADFIQQYFEENDQNPSERDISEGTGIPPSSVHRFLAEMRDQGEILFDGRRSVRTQKLDHISGVNLVPVLGAVACGPGQEEEEEFIEYLRMPESLVGKGEMFALIAKGESMVDAGIHPGDYVIVRKNQAARPNDIIVALMDGKNNLKKLVQEGKKVILRSCNQKNQHLYPDILPEEGSELQIQGVAIGVYHGLVSG